MSHFYEREAISIVSKILDYSPYDGSAVEIKEHCGLLRVILYGEDYSIDYFVDAIDNLKSEFGNEEAERILEEFFKEAERYTNCNDKEEHYCIFMSELCKRELEVLNEFNIYDNI